MKSKVYEGLSFYEVGELVNSIKHDSPDVILPKAEYEQLKHEKGLGRFFAKLGTEEKLKAAENKEESKAIEHNF
jgi:hypothetical protein